MRFTKDDDGIERTTVRVAIRLTRDEIKCAKAMAKYLKSKNWRTAIAGYAALTIEHELGEFDAEQLERLDAAAREDAK